MFRYLHLLACERSISLGAACGSDEIQRIVHRSDDLIAVVVPLQNQLDAALFHDRKHRSAQERCLFVTLVVGTGEEVFMHKSHTPSGIGSRSHLLLEPTA